MNRMKNGYDNKATVAKNKEVTSTRSNKKTILGWNFLANWLAGIALVYGTTFGIGKLIFGDLITGGILLFIAGAGFLIIYIGLRKGFDKTV